MKDKRWVPSVTKKLKEKLFIIDFCNLKEFTHENILSLQKKYHVVHTEDGKLRGYNTECFPRHNQLRKLWTLIEDEDALQLKKDHGEYIILPSEDKHKTLFSYLKKSQGTYTDFLNKCIKEEFDLKFISDLMNDIKSGFIFESIKEWEVILKPKELHLSSFESHIDWQIINLFLQGKGEVFKQVRICEWHKCGKYFLKYHREKFCSTTCANRQTSHKYRQNPPLSRS